MSDQDNYRGLAAAAQAVREMTRAIQEASEAIRQAYAEAARKINAAAKGQA